MKAAILAVAAVLTLAGCSSTTVTASHSGSHGPTPTSTAAAASTPTFTTNSPTPPPSPTYDDVGACRILFTTTNGVLFMQRPADLITQTAKATSPDEYPPLAQFDDVLQTLARADGMASPKLAPFIEGVYGPLQQVQQLVAGAGASDVDTSAVAANALAATQYCASVLPKASASG